MATTYDKDILSAEDYTKLEDAQNEWKAAKKAGDKAGMTAAHNRAEAIRAAYGYSGGTDGGGYTAIPGYEGAEQIQKATEQVKEAASGYDAAYDAVGDVYKAQAEASKADIAKQRESAMKEAYIGNMMDQKNLDQKLRAGGITGGLSETSKVAIQNNYRTNRNAVETAAIEAGKDVDLELSKNLAQNELSRADTKYNTTVNEANFQTNAANFQNTAANNNRNIVATEKQLKSEEENANLSKYLTFLDNGYVDDNNIGKISQAIGVSEDTIRKANAQRQNGQYENMALTLMSNGIYDDSFVNYFGGRFSAETLKAFTQQNVPKVTTKTSSGSSGGYIEGVNVGITSEELAANLGEIIKKDYYENARTVGNRGNTGNGGAKIKGVHYSSIKDYADYIASQWFDSGKIDSTVFEYLIDEFGVE